MYVKKLKDNRSARRCRWRGHHAGLYPHCAA